MAITTRNKLLTGSWVADVQVLESAIGHFDASRSAANDCQVVFFEIGRDGLLHVNVTHRHLTRAVKGWAGPAALPEGFVHNRTFGDTPPGAMIRHIREMVFAARM